MKKTKFFLMFFVGILTFWLYIVPAEAAPYRSVPETKTKIGNRYFKTDINGDIYVYSGNSTKSTRVTKRTCGGVTNGVYIYYAHGYWDSSKKTIYRYDIARKTTKKLCRLTMVELAGFYENELIYVQKDSSTRKSTYAYNLSTKKKRLFLKNVSGEVHREYVYGMEATSTSYKPEILKVYNSKTKKRTVIEKKTLCCQRIGDYLYYAKVIDSTEKGYKTRVVRYHLKSGKKAYVGNKSIYCSRVYSLTSSVISYRTQSGAYNYKKYK